MKNHFKKSKKKYKALEIEALIQRDQQLFNDFESIDLGVKKGLSFDEAVERAGGFGKELTFANLSKGLFHVYSLFFFMFALTTNGYLFFSLPFLELYPEYICPEELPNCNHFDRCAN